MELKSRDLMLATLHQLFQSHHNGIEIG